MAHGISKAICSSARTRMAPVTAAFRGSLSNRGASRARTAPVVTSALWCAQMPVAVPVVAATAFVGTAKRALCKAERVKEGFMIPDDYY